MILFQNELSQITGFQEYAFNPTTSLLRAFVVVFYLLYIFFQSNFHHYLLPKQLRCNRLLFAYELSLETRFIVIPHRLDVSNILICFH